MQMLSVIVLRGLPGSGKTRYIKETLCADRTTPSGILACSADDYRMVNGEYVFRPEDGARVHNQCFRAFLGMCDAHKSAVFDCDKKVVVDNTNLTVWEMAPYIRVAECFGFDCEIIRLECPWPVAAQRNEHGVPMDKIFRMHPVLEAERLPSHWKETIVLNGG